MTAAGFLSSIGALWWGASVGALIASFLAALLHPRRPGRIPAGEEMPPVTAIVPVRNLDAGFCEDQASLFAQSYAALEILIASTERESPALVAARNVQAAYPRVASRVVRSDFTFAASPKLNTLWSAINDARHDIILTKDSNVRLEPGDVESFVRRLEPGVGLVSTISIVTGPETLAGWVEASIINCYHARILMLAGAAGFGFGCGKIMLFRRSDLERSGGLRGLAWALGEDAALADAMAGIGLSTVLAAEVSRQVLGARHWREVWNRHLRWMLVWRTQAPAVFFGEFLGSALPTATAGALGARLAGMEPAAAAAGTLAAWCLLETLLCLCKGWDVSLWSPIAFLGREMLTLVLWLRAWTTDEVCWGGAMRRAGRRNRNNPRTSDAVVPTGTRE